MTLREPRSQLIKGLPAASLRTNTIPTSKEQDPVKYELSEGPEAKPAKLMNTGQGRVERGEEARGAEGRHLP